MIYADRSSASAGFLRKTNMQNNEVTIRRAVKEDAAQIARYFIYAWPVEEFFAMRPDLDMNALETAVIEVVSMEGTSYSYENSMVAVLGNKIKGAICGYDGAKCNDLKLRVRQVLADRFYDGDVEKVNWSEETGAGEFYLDSIGVDPECRGMGVGTKLFAGLLDKARSEGHSKAGLLVDSIRPEAEKLYTRLGFRFINYIDFCGHQMKHMQIEL